MSYYNNYLFDNAQKNLMQTLTILCEPIFFVMYIEKYTFIIIMTSVSNF